MAGPLQRIASFFATDVVALYNTNEDQVFADAIPMKVSVNATSLQFEHPLEDSSVITDHRVILPDEISLMMTIPKGMYKDVYAQMRSSYINGDLFQVRTKAFTYDNMVIQAMPHEETPEKFDAIDLILEMKETQFESVVIEILSFDKVEDKTQSDSVDRGEQNPETSVSAAAQITDSARELISGFFGG